MKLIDLTCQNCGAQLQINSELNRCVCNFCGKEMLIDNEVVKHQVEISNGADFGYQQGIGLKKSMIDRKNQELSMLKQFYNYYSLPSDKLKYELAAAQNRMKNTKSNDAYTVALILMWSFIILAVLGLSSIVLESISRETNAGTTDSFVVSIISWIMTLFVMTMPVIIPAIIITIFIVKAKHNNKQKCEKIKSECTQKCNDIPAYINNLYNSSNKIVSQQYASSQIVYTLINYLQNGRADTVKEAINLYEHERAQLIQMQKLNQINANAEAARRAAMLR